MSFLCIDIPTILEPCCVCLPFFKPRKQRRPSSKYMTDGQTRGQVISKQKELANGSNKNDEEIQRLYHTLAGSTGEVDAYSLQRLLNQIFNQKFQFDGFSIESCRSMVALNDTDFSGKLSYEQFKVLCLDLKKLEGEFQRLDHDSKGFFKSHEFEEIISRLGLPLKENTLKVIRARYVDKDGKVYFNDFVSCAIRLKIMTESFNSKKIDHQGNKRAKFTPDEFLQLTMYS